MSSIIKVNTIQDVGGNNLLISNGSGTITTNNIAGENTPSFYATLSSNISDFTANQYNTIVFDSERWDTNSDYNNSTGIFTPSVAGKYFCYAQAKMGNFGDGGGSKFMTLAFFWNGTSTQTGQTNIEANGETTIIASNIITFNGSTDNIQVRGYQNDGAGTRFVVGGHGGSAAAYSFFHAFRIIGA